MNYYQKLAADFIASAKAWNERTRAPQMGPKQKRRNRFMYHWEQVRIKYLAKYVPYYPFDKPGIE